MNHSSTKLELPQQVYDDFDDYVHGRIARRDFLQRLASAPIAPLTATAVFSYLTPSYASAVQVPVDDKRVVSGYAEYESAKGGGRMRGLMCSPAGADKRLPAVLVVHENRGLNPHIEDVCRRAALAGYLAFAPDALWPLGGYPGNDDDGRNMQKERDRDEILEDFLAAFDWLKAHPKSNGKLGVVGFCFGGWVSNMLAARRSDLAAAVPFYGGGAPLEEVVNIKAPLLLQFAENDAWVNKGWPDYEAALKKHSKSYQAHTYPGTQHGFHNDTTPRFDEAAAALAWKRTLEFFDQHLRSTM